LLDIHWNLVALECPASFNRIMSCIIGHANPKNGVCCLRHKTIAVETGYSVETVKRAIKWWTQKQFLRTESRGRARALAYHPAWKLFEIFWTAVSADMTQQKSEVIKGTYAEVIKGTYDGGQYGDLQNLKDRTSKDESHPERAPSSRDAREREEKGFSGKSQTELPANLSESAAKRVRLFISSDVFFAANPPSPEAVEAAVLAEMREEGSGRAIISRAANDTWKARRSA
jgi:hypothetical protein